MFIKGGGGRSDGGSYAQMHLKKMQMESGATEETANNHSTAPRFVDTCFLLVLDCWSIMSGERGFFAMLIYHSSKISCHIHS